VGERIIVNNIFFALFNDIKEILFFREQGGETATLDSSWDFSIQVNCSMFVLGTQKT
jgi:hypothetical protein